MRRVQNGKGSEEEGKEAEAAGQSHQEEGGDWDWTGRLGVGERRAKPNTATGRKVKVKVKCEVKWSIETRRGGSASACLFARPMLQALLHFYLFSALFSFVREEGGR